MKLNNNQPILNQIFNLPRSKKQQIYQEYNKLGFSIQTKINDLTLKQKFKLTILINNFLKNSLPWSKKTLIDSNFKKIQKNQIKRFIDTKHYKGFRFIFNLPVNGQNTHSNRRTAKKLNKP